MNFMMFNLSFLLTMKKVFTFIFVKTKFKEDLSLYSWEHVFFLWAD